MRVAIIYRYESDHAREVLDYLRDFSRQTGHAIEEIDPDSPDGAHFCRTYDIVEYPTMVAVDSEGRLHNMWRGRPLPTIREVSYYV
ncbi:hypothetical protein B7Z00_00370 [Candidatus Saccharibacteria bacterium 32-50-10]|nr:MAG: hypothetical protein B7Z00_00370 [Candidatus Saccharibacteria bacterium 32-50-10]